MASKQKFTHTLIAETAKEMAACWYEEAAHDNDFFHFYPKQVNFVKREWKLFVEPARETLAKMLGNELVPEWQKEQIFDALVKHASMPGNIDRRIVNQMTNPESLMVVH